MVFYFKSDVSLPGFEIFMGKDKHENEELIRWGWPEDVWFHVDKFSSAHVYLRLNMGQTIENLPVSVIEDAAQLTKANSIQGNKNNNIDVVYTMWNNLKKLPCMEVGQVSFHQENMVHKFRIEKRINEIVNRLNKTKKELDVDFRARKETRDALEKQTKKRMVRQIKEAQKKKQKELELETKVKNYSEIMKLENMKSNYDDGNDSDDFM